MMDEDIEFRVHAIRRMAQRGISMQDVKHVLESGDIIENYPDDQPYPSQLLLGWAGGRPLHIVVAQYETDSPSIIITVYEPDPRKWEDGFSRRKK